MRRCRKRASSGSTLPDSLPGTAQAAAPLLRSRDERPRSSASAAGYWRLAGGFWRGATARAAWKLTIASLFLVVANTTVQYGVNKWNAFFFDALQQKSYKDVASAMAFFAVLAVAASMISVFSLTSRVKLQVYWRQWLTKRLTSQWLDSQRFYRLSIAAPDLDAPEFRIAEDARVATEPVVEFGTGILNAVLAALVFFVVLWSIGGDIELFGTRIPGFMVIAAVLYSGVMSGSMLIFGRPLIRRIEEKNAAEAKLRTEMGRVRENAESIALIGGEADEIKALHETLHGLVESWMRMLKQWARMMWLMGSNWAVAPVVPLLLEAPNFLAGKMTLGALMQTAAAFAQVQVALNWIFDNYPRIAEWMASAGRVTGLWAAFGRLDSSVGLEAHEHIVIGESPDDHVRLEHLSVAQFDGRVMIDEATTEIGPGERVLLTGESGTGKSTLIRAIAGLWPWGSGRVLFPADARVAFLPQRAYIPNGTLRQVLHYPITARDPTTEELEVALRRCGLGHLVSRLDDEDRWDKLLSGGEQQRIGFVRLLVQKPDVVILDEATAALDVDTQASIMNLFNDELGRTTLISVGHRPELAEFHHRRLSLRRTATEVSMEGDRVRRRRLSQLLRRTLRPRPGPDASRPPGSPPTS
ncbi:MAG: ABC transporter ATP-binding protein/permease [Acetobacteraceae bacterium]|nr:ABC transporter ATP-binding protein/permease [Acetobacteraceae bacterium]